MTAPDPEGLRILKEWDVEASKLRFMSLMNRLGVAPQFIATDGHLAGMHKARLMLPKEFTFEQRKESRDWLRAHGYKVP